MPAASSVRDAPFYLRTPPRDVRVTNWGLRDDPWRSIAAMLLAAAVAGAASFYTHSVIAGSLAAAALGVSLWRTWLPIGYEFDPAGVTQIVIGRRRAVPWLAISAFEFTPRGVLLFPHGEPTRWNAARALFVHWSGKRQEITEVVEYFLGGRLLLEESSRSQLGAATTDLEQPRETGGQNSDER
jgi:hypothetical protein